MLEKILSAKYWALIVAVLFLGACAKTAPVKTTPTAPVAAKPKQESVVAKPAAPVVVEPMVENTDTQSSLDAATSDSLVYFGYDRYDLSANAQAALKDQVAWLTAHADVRVTVEGNCDERGTREYNLALGDRRANSVKNYMVALGIDPSRIHTVSYGKERPLVVGTGEAIWSKNRRAYTRVN